MNFRNQKLIQILPPLFQIVYHQIEPLTWIHIKKINQIYLIMMLIMNQSQMSIVLTL